MSEKRVEEAPAELSAKVRPPPAPPSRLAPARRARPTGRPLPAAPTARPTEGRARPSANGERGRGARGPARGIPLSEVGGGGGGGAARRGAARGRGGRRAPGGAAPSFGSGRARGAPRGFSGRQKSGKPTEREHKGGSQTAGGAPTTCRPAPAGGGRRREPRREGAVPWPGAALPSAARLAPRRAASRAALRGWESRAARRPPSAPPFSVSCPEPSLSETARPIGFVSGR